MARGEARVLVGTRSAIFTPLPEAGLIVIDEEHDGSYKQQDGIRYHARDFALVRAKALGIPVLLGSATPSLESLHNALSGRYALAAPAAARRRRAAAASARGRRAQAPAHARPVEGRVRRDRSSAWRAASRRWCSRTAAAMRRCCSATTAAGARKCKRCDAPMTVHASAAARLICHHCGARGHRPLSCPDCASLALQPQGFGTERLEEALAATLSARRR